MQTKYTTNTICQCQYKILEYVQCTNITLGTKMLPDENLTKSKERQKKESKKWMPSGIFYINRIVRMIFSGRTYYGGKNDWKWDLFSYISLI